MICTGNKYNFDISGKEIRCACQKCRRDAYLTSSFRDYESDYDAINGLLADCRDRLMEIDQRENEFLDNEILKAVEKLMD